MANLIDTINTKVTDTTKKVYGNSNLANTKAVLSTPTQGGMSTNTTLASTVTPTVDIVKSAQSTVGKETPITTDLLKSTDKIVLPDKNITDTGTNFTLPEVTTPLQAEQNRLKAEKATQEGGIQTLLKNIGIEQGKEATFATELGADKAQQEYDRFASELEAEQLGTRRRVESLQKNNPQGLFGGGLEQEVSRIERESLSKQADIAILGNAAKGRFDTAMSIAKRKVESALRPMQAELDAKKFVYENNKELFSKAELSKLDSLVKVDERKIKAEEDRLTKGNEMIINALSQGASMSSVNKAKELLSKGSDITTVASSLGKYAGDYLGNELKRSTISKNYAEADKAQKELAGLNIDISTLPNTTTGFITKLASSAKNSKELDATERQSLSKARTVIGQLDSLQSNISKQNGTGLIKGKVGNLFEKFGANADVGTINAQLQAIVPNLARGTYGEVGVLTDNDIENYRKTLPRLDRPQDQNDAVMALTLKTVLNSMENTLSGAANSGINVSGWTQDYIKIKNQINTVEDRIGVSKEAVNTLVASDPTLLPAVKEMYQNGLTDREILEAVNAD